MTDTLIKYPDIPTTLAGRFNWRMLKYFGAGAILASVTIGSGETLMASRGGSIFGYSVLWAVLLASAAKAVQVYTAARHITLTGRHPLEDWARMTLWIPLLLLGMSLWCFPFLLSFLSLVLGEIINEMFHVATPNDPDFRLWTRIWATGATVLAIALTLIQGYSLMEKVQTAVIGLLLLSIGAACLASNPDLLAVIQGLFVPVSPQYQPWLIEKYPEAFRDRTPWVEITTILGFVGGGTYDYLGYVSCLREKSWGAIRTGSDSSVRLIADDTDNLRRGRKWLVPPCIDVTTSFVCVFVFSICFVVLGASVLHPQEIVPAKNGELLTHQAQFLTQLHPAFLYLYRIGVFMAFWGTIYGAYEIYWRTVYECLRPVSEKIRRMSSGTVRLCVLLYCGVGAIALSWLTENPIGLITIPSLIGGVLSCGLWCFGMMWLDRKSLPTALRMKPVLRIATFVSGALLTSIGVKAFYDYVASPLG
ncbi:MAG: Nramp family divalent metal transporter [Fuerstiella sp.]|nr:Nramp family divalent metal transporter [Fuerstiella sp.]